MNNKQGFVRKQFFIDKKMQGRYMITFLIPMLVLLCFFLVVLYAASQSIISTTTSMLKEEVDNKIAVEFQDNINPPVESYQVLVKNIQNSVRDFSSDIKYRKAVLSTLLFIFGIGLLIIVVQITLLTIFFSHKLAGPVFRFEKACHNLIEGNYTDKIYLRRGDEMQNLAGLLNEVIRVSNERLTAMKDAKTDDERHKIVSTLKL